MQGPGKARYQLVFDRIQTPWLARGFGLYGGFVKAWLWALLALNIGLGLLFLVSLGSDVWEFYLTLFLGSLAPHLFLLFSRKNKG